MPDKDYYSALGLTREAHPDVVRAAYYALVKKYHPDATGDDPALVIRFREISEAWETLSRPDRREAYDRSSDNEPPSKPPSGATASDNAANANFFLVGVCGFVLLVGLILGIVIFGGRTSSTITTNNLPKETSDWLRALAKDSAKQAR